MHMTGSEVFSSPRARVVESCQKMLDDAEIGVEDVDLFVPHQANIRIIESASRRLGLQRRARSSPTSTATATRRARRSRSVCTRPARAAASRRATRCSWSASARASPGARASRSGSCEPEPRGAARRPVSRPGVAGRRHGLRPVHAADPAHAPGLRRGLARCSATTCRTSAAGPDRRSSAAPTSPSRRCWRHSVGMFRMLRRGGLALRRGPRPQPGRVLGAGRDRRAALRRRAAHRAAARRGDGCAPPRQPRRHGRRAGPGRRRRRGALRRPDGVWPANFNSPGQVVVSGAQGRARGAAEEAARAAGARRVVRARR